MTHEQVRQLVRGINPVPYPSMLETVDAPVPDLERSMDMQVDERPVTEDRRESRWRGPLIGIAATVAVLIGVLLFINTDEDDVAIPAPDATPLETIEMGQSLAPGPYFANTDATETPDGDASSSIRGTFVIEGAGWSSITGHGAMKEHGDRYVSLMIVEVEEVYSTVCAMSGRGPTAAASTAEGLASQFAGNGFIVREALAPVSAFGFDGQKLVMEVPAGCADELDQAWNGGLFQGRYYQGDGQVLEYYFLDVEGTPVMVEASWFPSSSDEDIAELRAVLDTLVITS